MLEKNGGGATLQQFYGRRLRLAFDGCVSVVASPCVEVVSGNWLRPYTLDVLLIQKEGSEITFPIPRFCYNNVWISMDVDDCHVLSEWFTHVPPLLLIISPFPFSLCKL